jgi:predicted metal-binding protein
MMGGRAELVACETCGGASTEGLARGARMLVELRRALEGAGDIGIDVAPVRCLWACKKSCAVLLRSSERAGYVIVELEPSAEVAHALLDYARLYVQSPDGAVPYKAWPAVLKGHFHCRIPRLPAAAPGGGATPALRDENQ